MLAEALGCCSSKKHHFKPMGKTQPSLPPSDRPSTHGLPVSEYSEREEDGVFGLEPSPVTPSGD